MPKPAPRRSALWIVPLVYLLFVAGEFMAMTHIALDLTGRGYSGLAVGAVASAMWSGIFTASLLAHRCVARWGYDTTFVAGCLLATAALAGMGSGPAFYTAWLVGASLLGVAGGLVWVTGESWLAQAAPRARRGFYIGMFETAVGLGMVAGPLLLEAARAVDAAALPAASGLLLAASLASTALWRSGPSVAVNGPGMLADATGPAPSQRPGLPLASMVVLAGVLESGSSAMLPPIALRLGFDIAAAALLGSVIGAGSALMQVPFGALADRCGIARVMLAAWAALLLTAATLAGFAQDPGRVLWVAGFLLGGVGGAVYTLVVIEFGHRLTGPALVRAMSLLVTAYTAGTALGPALGGALFDAFGLRGLALALCMCALAGATLAARALGTTGRSDAKPAAPSSS